MGLARADEGDVSASLNVHPGTTLESDDVLGFGGDSQWYHPFELEDGGTWLEAGTVHDGYLLRYPGLIDFRVSDLGRRVDAYPHADTPSDTVRHLFLAQVWPILLSLRGHLVLHASAVRLGDRAVAFVGHTGQGKSTLAASFNRRGYALVTDDVLLLDREDETVRAVPSYPEQRLWSDSAAQLADTPEAMQRVAHYTEKRALHLSVEHRAFEHHPVPLAALFWLDADVDCENIAAKPLGLSEAYVALLDQVFRLDFSDRELMRREVQQLTDLVHSVPVFSLRYPRRYHMLNEVHEAVAAAAGLSL